MRENPECPRCGLLLDGVSTPQGGAPRRKPFPDRSTGYCVNCHIGLTKTNGAWAAASPARLSR